MDYFSAENNGLIILTSKTHPVEHSAGERSGPEFIKLFSCSTQLSMIFFLLINVKMPTIVGILTFMSGKNSNLGLSEPKKAEFLDIFIFRSIYNFMLNSVEHDKKFITSGPD